ncbi:MAG: DUF1294 domain-containing protein [Anaerolineaceae bacterium]|nr:DUF1294 domain-containing protein [Anaerolineaceae bacterium]
MKLLYIVIIWMAVMSAAAFAAFGLDKYKAKNNRWRIRERTLFLLAILGGGIGAFLGMKVFRHKTQHTQFVFGIPAIMIVQLVLLGVLIWKTAG